jgi:hypothetical protein
MPEEATGMIQKDIAKGFDTDIMQCKKDIERARQSATLAQIKTHKNKKKEQTAKSQEIPEKKSHPPIVEKSTQLFNRQKKTDIEVNGGFPVREQSRYITKTVHIDQTNANQTNATPTSESAEGSSADIVKLEEEQPAVVENYGAKNKDTSEIKYVTEKKEENAPSEKPLKNDSTGNSENTQSNEVKFIQQVKSMKSGNNRTNRRQVPRFDLAEQIMAEQRKNSAIRRKAPGVKDSSIEEQKNSNYKPTYQSKQEPICEEEQFFSAKQEIIAIIVKRDIERLCKNGDSRGK